MAVYPRPDQVFEWPHRRAPTMRETIELVMRENERAREREARRRNGVIDLMEINGVWQVPPRG